MSDPLEDIGLFDEFLDDDQEQQCIECGCSNSDPCPGGCVWATPNLCSRCARAE